MKSARGMPQNVQTRWLCSPFFYWPSNFFWRANKALKPKLRNRPSVIIFDICQLLTEKQTKKSKSAYVSSCIECIWSKKLKGFAAIKGFCVFCVFLLPFSDAISDSQMSAKKSVSETGMEGNVRAYENIYSLKAK